MLPNTGTGTGSSPWRTEGQDLVRATSGGLLFGVPLLYTIEVMWTGQHTTAPQALVVLGASLASLTVLNRTAGFRAKADLSLGAALMDAVEGVAIGLVVVATVLVLLGQLDSATPLGVALGRVIYETLPVSLGIGVANTLLREQPAATEAAGSEAAGSPVNATVADLGANVVGAAFVALSIAPTDEVPMMTASRHPLELLAIVVTSLLIAYAIVFAAGLTGQARRHAQGGLLQHPLVETLAAYLVSLLTAWLLLWLFQRADGPWAFTLGQVIVLGLPAAIGGAAGRLAL